MTLCHQCAHWQGKRDIDPETPLRAPKEEWRDGVCDELSYGNSCLEVEIKAGWNGGTLGKVKTPASFGCMLAQPLGSTT